MKGFALGLSLSIAFILGCAAAPLIVPRMSAQQQAAGIQRWEYQCMVVGGATERRTVANVTERANEMGAEGWEAWLYDPDYLCFKRPLL